MILISISRVHIALKNHFYYLTFREEFDYFGKVLRVERNLRLRCALIEFKR